MPSFTRLDQLQYDEAMIIGEAFARRQALMPDRVKTMLRQLEEQVDDFPVNELVHSLQTATRAIRANASDEMVVAALCHDIGKVICLNNHAAIGAEILKPYVSQDTYQIVLTHNDFQARYYNALVGRDPNVCLKYADRSWYQMACRFSEEWDQISFDPNYDTLPLEHFEPLIDSIFARPRPATD